MKKVLCIAFAALMMLALVACGGGNQPQTGSETPEWITEVLGHEPTGRLKEILDKGELNYVFSPDYAPMEFVDPNKSGDASYVGADIELAKYFAAQLGVELKLNANDFDACQTLIGQNMTDIGISGFTPDPDREKTMTFTENYYVCDYQGVLVRLEDKDNYPDYASFNGKTVAAQNASVQQTLAEQWLVPQGAKLQVVTKVTDGILMLQTGTIDGVVMEVDPGEAAALANPELAMAGVKLQVEETGYACAIPKSDDPEYNKDYLTVLNHMIGKVVDEGLYLGWREDALKLQAELGA